MEVSVEYLGAVQFEIKARQHSVVCDQPTESGGDDEGMTSPELLLASLGSCAAYYAVDYLKRNQLSPEATRVRVTAEKAKAPLRVDNFKIEVDVPGELSLDQLRGVEDVVHRCLIHATLMHPPQVDVHVNAVITA